MGKKRLRKKITSKKIHGSGFKNSIIAAVRADREAHEVMFNKIAAWAKGQNPWITIPNPVKTATNKPFIRVRANDHFGPWNKLKEPLNDNNLQQA